MFQLLSKIALIKSFRRFGLPRMLPVNVTVSLTGRCNSRCKTCNIYKNKTDEMSVDEYGRIFRSMGRAPYWITFSGGEPFLRTDIEDICISAYENCSPGLINIPTNGLLTDRIVKGVRHILDHCPETNLIINLSIDGIGDRHDEIRGVKGCFVRAMETYKKLRALNYPNFTLGIHTVISRFNVKEIPSIYKEIKALSPDSYITEIAEERVELGTVGAGITPSVQDYCSAIDFLSGEMKSWEVKNISRITRAFRMRYYEMVKQVFRENREIIPCYAAVASCQITPDGDVWNCCIKAESMGNLKDSGYDLKKIWFSGAAERLRNKIRNRHCFCPLANASYTNMLLSFKTMRSITGKLIHQ